MVGCRSKAGTQHPTKTLSSLALSKPWEPSDKGIEPPFSGINPRTPRGRKAKQQQVSLNQHQTAKSGVLRFTKKG